MSKQAFALPTADHPASWPPGPWRLGRLTATTNGHVFVAARRSYGRLPRLPPRAERTISAWRTRVPRRSVVTTASAVRRFGAVVEPYTRCAWVAGVVVDRELVRDVVRLVRPRGTVRIEALQLRGMTIEPQQKGNALRLSGAGWWAVIAAMLNTVTSVDFDRPETWA